METLLVTEGAYFVHRPLGNEVYKHSRKLKQQVIWVELLQSYTFVMKHKLGKENKVTDALSKRALMLAIMRNDTFIFEKIKHV